MNYSAAPKMPDGECLIYAIRNSYTNNMYVGSTVEPHRRWVCHKRELNRGRHTALPLQRAWHKHGPEVFEFAPLLVCQTSDRNMFEAGFIASMGSYNLMKKVGVPPGGGMMGKKLSLEAREAISRKASERHAKNRAFKFDPLCEDAWRLVQSGTPKYKACKIVGISHDTFWRWLGKHGYKEWWNR